MLLITLLSYLVSIKHGIFYDIGHCLNGRSHAAQSGRARVYRYRIQLLCCPCSIITAALAANLWINIAEVICRCRMAGENDSIISLDNSLDSSEDQEGMS